MWSIIYLFVPIIVFAVLAFKYIRKRELGEIEKFKSGPKLENEVYLESIGLCSGTEDAETALWLRSIIANLAKIPEQSIRGEHCLWIMSIEEQFKISIPDEFADKIVGGVFAYDKNLTIKDVTIRLIEFLQKVKSEHSCDCPSKTK